MVVLTKRRSDTTEQIYRFFIAISGILHPNPEAQGRKAVTLFGSRIFLTTSGGRYAYIRILVPGLPQDVFSDPHPG
jgi:hypothetical protein